MGGTDNRRHDRLDIALVVDYEGADDLVSDFTINLSSGGTFVQTAREFEVGTRITLSLSFPGLLESIRIPGTVRWTRGGGDDRRGVGIEFDEDADMLERVQSLLDRIEQGDPRLVSKVISVLVVEDNPHVSRLIRDGLSGGTKRAFGDAVQFTFQSAANGRDALDKLQAGDFDVLVIDVYLPVMDGPAVISAVRADERLADMPIIAVSAGGKPAREAALTAGANFFLEKPMRLREVIETMRKLTIVSGAT